MRDMEESGRKEEGREREECGKSIILLVSAY